MHIFKTVSWDVTVYCFLLQDKRKTVAHSLLPQSWREQISLKCSHVTKLYGVIPKDFNIHSYKTLTFHMCILPNKQKLFILIGHRLYSIRIQNGHGR
jgi:hypothetical protein